jgi:hypothetical protein
VLVLIGGGVVPFKKSEKKVASDMNGGGRVSMWLQRIPCVVHPSPFDVKVAKEFAPIV